MFAQYVQYGILGTLFLKINDHSVNNLIEVLTACSLAKLSPRVQIRLKIHKVWQLYWQGHSIKKNAIEEMKKYIICIP